jgi:hypothetical protein
MLDRQKTQCLVYVLFRIGRQLDAGLVLDLDLCGPRGLLSRGLYCLTFV